MSNLTIPAEPLRLQCMEIWGGNTATETGLSVTGIDAWIVSRPHQGDSAGGDIHYVSMCGAGRIVRFVVADVSGHGHQADALAVQLRAMMRKHINTLNQARFARTLNREFSAFSGRGAFATAVLATYFAPTDHLVLVNAGHPPPLWYRRADRRWRVLTDDLPERADRIGNLPLGIIQPTSYSQFAVRLEQGDLVLVYTDSVPESRNPQGEALQLEGLLSAVRGLDPDSPDQICRALTRYLADYRGGLVAEDDTTLLLLYHNGADPAGNSAAGWTRVVAKMLGLMKV
jgi:phosphoserine phosphatase RsbU/P